MVRSCEMYWIRSRFGNLNNQLGFSHKGILDSMRADMRFSLDIDISTCSHFKVFHPISIMALMTTWTGITWKDAVGKMIQQLPVPRQISLDDPAGSSPRPSEDSPPAVPGFLGLGESAGVFQKNRWEPYNVVPSSYTNWFPKIKLTIDKYIQCVIYVCIYIYGQFPRYIYSL